VGLPYADKHGADISDYFCKYGGTADKLADEFDRLRDDDPAGHDEVSTAIEALLNTEDEHRTTLITEARADDDILEMKPARYVMDDWLPVGFFSDFFGEPGSKKTFVLLDMLRHIRAGMDWHGHRVTQGAALLFEGEGSEQLQTRIVAWDEHTDHPALAPGASFETSVDITTPGGVAAVARTVRDYERMHNTSVVAVAFDPLVEFMTGEKSATAWSRRRAACVRWLVISTSPWWWAPTPTPPASAHAVLTICVCAPVLTLRSRRCPTASSWSAWCRRSRRTASAAPSS